MNVWMNGLRMEAYDLGPCRGYAANGDYHHHDLSSCNGTVVNQEHSEVYGVAADGYLIHGPYNDSGQFAESAGLPEIIMIPMTRMDVAAVVNETV